MKSRDKAFDSKYDNFVAHPLYGQRPRHTGMNPNPYEDEVHLHPNATTVHEIQKRAERILGKRLPFLKPLERITPQQLPRIPGTAIQADPSRQNNAIVPVTHYYDVERVCRGCQRPFIFFAEQQRHWFEELGMRLEVDCVRCSECRRKERGTARKRAEYERLLALPKRSWTESLSLCECALALVEARVFHQRVIERVRAELKKVPAAERDADRYQEVLARMKCF